MQPWSSTVLAKEELLRWRDNLEACNGRVDGTQMETSEFSRADEDEPITKTLEEDEDTDGDEISNLQNNIVN